MSITEKHSTISLTAVTCVTTLLLRPPTLRDIIIDDYFITCYVMTETYKEVPDHEHYPSGSADFGWDYVPAPAEKLPIKEFSDQAGLAITKY